MFGAHFGCSSIPGSSSSRDGDLVHVVRAPRGVRQHAGQVAVRDRIRRDLPLLRQQRHERAGVPEGRLVVVGHQVHHARPPAVRLRAAQPRHVDVFAGHRPHHVRPGDEDPAVAGQDHHVRQGRPVGGAAGRRAEHHGDLRHHAGRRGHRGEYRADAVQRRDALGQPRAAGVPQADHRHTARDGLVVGRDDHRAAVGAHRAALDPRVGGERDRAGPVDQAARGDRAGPVGGDRGEQGHGARVEQRGEPADRVARQGNRGRGRPVSGRPGSRLLGNGGH